MTERCLIRLQGCDDATWAFLDVTPAETAVLVRAELALNAARGGFSCKPGMQVRVGADVDVDEDGDVVATFDTCRPGDLIGKRGAEPNCGDRRGDVVCTRPTGHRGHQHVATTGPSRRVVAAWSVEGGPQ